MNKYLKSDILLYKIMFYIQIYMVIDTVQGTGIHRLYLTVYNTFSYLKIQKPRCSEK